MTGTKTGCVLLYLKNRRKTILARTPFTQELLHQILDETGIMSLELLTEALPDWSLTDIKSRLAGWRYRGVINYTTKDGEIEEFSFLKNRKVITEEINAGRLLKLEKYFKQVLATAEIIAKPTATDTNKLKAIQLQQQAMDEIPDFYFKELSEIEA